MPIGGNQANSHSPRGIARGCIGHPPAKTTANIGPCASRGRAGQTAPGTDAKQSPRAHGPGSLPPRRHQECLTLHHQRKVCSHQQRPGRAPLNQGQGPSRSGRLRALSAFAAATHLLFWGWQSLLFSPFSAWPQNCTSTAAGALRMAICLLAPKWFARPGRSINGTRAGKRA